MAPRHRRLGRIVIGAAALGCVGVVVRVAMRRMPGPDPIMVGDCWPPVPLNEERPIEAPLSPSA